MGKIDSPATERERQVREFLTAYAAESGLGFFGLVPLGPEAEYSHFRDWVAAGKHATMEFLERNHSCRADPSVLLENGRVSAIFGLNYFQGDRLHDKARNPRIAQYARLTDYHKTLRGRLDSAGGALGRFLNLPVKYRACVDSAPILERALAARTGGGFVGKNTCFISPVQGSWFLLGELLLDIDLGVESQPAASPSTRTATGGCGTCRRCQVHCPTGALDEDYRLDARRCLSFHTIENRGTIPVEYWPHLAKYIYGCDICQLACPYNRAASPASEAVKVPSAIDPRDLATMSADEYIRRFAGTPMTRAKVHGLRRNGLIALIVRDDPRLECVIQELNFEESPILQATLDQLPEYRASIAKETAKN